jgi:hypothetical protein
VLSAILAMVAVLAIGARVADSVRVRQEEVLLRKLPEAQAIAFYEVLRQRVRRVRVLRAITLLSLVLVMVAARRRFFPPPPPRTPDHASVQRPTNTDAARVLADRALQRFAARERLEASGFQLADVRGDERHPWIFEYRGRDGGLVRVYVDRDGTALASRASPGANR